jgi:hypothetical protein
MEKSHTADAIEAIREKLRRARCFIEPPRIIGSGPSSEQSGVDVALTAITDAVEALVALYEGR